RSVEAVLVTESASLTARETMTVLGGSVVAVDLIDSGRCTIGRFSRWRRHMVAAPPPGRRSGRLSAASWRTGGHPAICGRVADARAGVAVRGGSTPAARRHPDRGRTHRRVLADPAQAAVLANSAVRDYAITPAA